MITSRPHKAPPPNTTPLPWKEVYQLAARVAKRLKRNHPTKKRRLIYGVPRGGCVAAAVVVDYCNRQGEPASLVDDPSQATVIVDDVIDSGETMQQHGELYDVPFVALVDKTVGEFRGQWLVFPWEQADEAQGPTQAVTRLLEFIGEDPTREGLKNTPQRVVNSYGEIFSGYETDVSSLFTVFEDGACDEMVVLKDIEYYSCCEHHMQPFFGKACIAYIPQDKVIGVSKLARILDAYSRRLQIQERIAQQVTSALMQHLQPKGAACVLTGQHFCMVCRGVRKQNASMVTSSLEGAFKDDPATRAEFMTLIR